jgi:hypothetical protein
VGALAHRLDDRTARGGSRARRKTVNLCRKSKELGAAFVVGVVLAGAAAAGAAASDGTPKGMSPQAFHALQARSQALNDAYGLSGNDAGMTAADVAAALSALEARSDALDARYHLGAYAESRPTTGFDWTDAGIGAGGALGIVLVAAGLAVGTHRFRVVPRTT